MRIFNVPAGPNDPFRLSSPALLEAAAVSAGFDEAAVSRATVAYEYASAGEFTEAQRIMHESRLTTLLERPSEKQSAFWRELGVAAQAYAGPDGVVRLPSEILLLKARRP